MPWKQALKAEIARIVHSRRQRLFRLSFWLKVGVVGYVAALALIHVAGWPYGAAIGQGMFCAFAGGMLKSERDWT